jgi:hypothetical protein
VTVDGKPFPLDKPDAELNLAAGKHQILVNGEYIPLTAEK